MREHLNTLKFALTYTPLADTAKPILTNALTLVLV